MPAAIDRQDQRDTWLRAGLRVVNPVVSYRWLNGTGLHSHDVADAADFRITTFVKPPQWATGTMYQVFPDRFAKSIERPAPAWARLAAWDDPVIGEGPDTPRQWYGGDLDGITEHLDYIASLGVGTIYKALDAAVEHPILGDQFAADAVARIDYDFKELKLPNGSEITLPMRAWHFGQWTRAFLATNPEAPVLHLGCGFDTRVYRIDPGPNVRWYDIDYPDVIALREQLYSKREKTGVAAYVAEAPMACVAMGAGKALENYAIIRRSIGGL